MTAADWADLGNCVGMPPTVMFPTTEADLAAAKTICDGCAVKPQCLQHALDNHEDHGVWGGTTSAERRAIRARLKATS